MERKRVMVTGANGFVGRHVVAALAARGCGVIGVSRQDEVDPQIGDLVEAYYECDLVDLAEAQTLPWADVDVVINLAGLAAVGESFSQPELYMQVNAGVIDSVCQVALEYRPSLRVIAISTGAVYAGGQELPLGERAVLSADSSPYAASKVAMEERARAYRTAGLDCVIARPFNHIGPGQSPGFLVPDLFRQVEQARTEGDIVRVGNLTTRRDYTDVRDVAQAYVALALAETLTEDTYNICTGRSVAGTEILAIMLSALGVPDLDVVVDPKRFRPADQPDIFGDSGRLRMAVDWEPSIPVEQSIRDFVGVATGSVG